MKLYDLIQNAYNKTKMNIYVSLTLKGMEGMIYNKSFIDYDKTSNKDLPFQYQNLANISFYEAKGKNKIEIYSYLETDSIEQFLEIIKKFKELENVCN